MNALFKLLAATLALALLSACGGSSDDDDGPCGSVVDISPDGMLNGTLTTSDCEIDELFPGTGDDSLADQYRVTVTMPVSLTITLRSTDFDAFLAILGVPDGCADIPCDLSVILQTDDDSGGGLDSQIVVFLNPGSYTIIANSLVRASGSYTIETSTL